MILDDESFESRRRRLLALLSRLSYAEPLSINGSLNLTIHWDRTNGARNDRFSDI